MKLATVLVLLLSRLALADGREIALESVCAEAETSEFVDQAERTAARALLARTLERENLLVVETGCTQTYRVGHHLAAGKWTVRIAGPSGSRRWTNATVERYPDIYRDLVHALIEMPVVPATIPSVPAVPAAPGIADPFAPPPPDAPLAVREIEGPPPAPFPIATSGSYPTPVAYGNPDVTSAWYGTAGFGGVGGVGAGMALGFGYRRATGTLAFDGSVSGVAAAEGSSFKFSFEALRLGRSRAERKPQEGTGYYGGGASFGATEIGDGMYESATIKGTGLAGELTAGYVFESDGPSLFIQADLSLPLYTAGNAYPAMFTVGLGYGKL